ncbi:hypothetical protein AN958_02198 [Leucoagaricus sp. SymC.cos]|nr:hypothetical protein AN958_02198 [Leucoagaricus sp. SymC.cos]
MSLSRRYYGGENVSLKYGNCVSGNGSRMDRTCWRMSIAFHEKRAIVNAKHFLLVQLVELGEICVNPHHQTVRFACKRQSNYALIVYSAGAINVNSRSKSIHLLGLPSPLRWTNRSM